MSPDTMVGKDCRTCANESACGNEGIDNSFELDGCDCKDGSSNDTMSISIDSYVVTGPDANGDVCICDEDGDPMLFIDAGRLVRAINALIEWNIKVEDDGCYN